MVRPLAEPELESSTRFCVGKGRYYNEVGALNMLPLKCGSLLRPFAHGISFQAQGNFSLIFFV